VDISGWTVSGAVQHTFTGGTVIPANSTYYVVANVAQFKLRTTGPRGGQQLAIQGNFSGQLANGYGELFLQSKNGAPVASTSYGVPPIAGDFDSSGTVDNLDYDLWKSTFGSTTDLRADANGDGGVDAGDYTVWRDNLGATNLGAGSATEFVETEETWVASFENVGDDTSPAPQLSLTYAMPSLHSQPQSLTPSMPRSSQTLQVASATRELALLAVLTERAVVAVSEPETEYESFGEVVSPAVEIAFGELFEASMISTTLAALGS
jgi:hypothetical protein